MMTHLNLHRGNSAQGNPAEYRPYKYIALDSQLGDGLGIYILAG
jgi:hypothetical protein